MSPSTVELTLERSRYTSKWPLVSKLDGWMGPLYHETTWVSNCCRAGSLLGLETDPCRVWREQIWPPRTAG